MFAGAGKRQFGSHQWRLTDLTELKSNPRNGKVVKSRQRSHRGDIVGLRIDGAIKIVKQKSSVNVSSRMRSLFIYVELTTSNTKYTTRTFSVQALKI